MKIALAQINPTVGDFENNLQRILDFTKKAQELKADLVIFPELGLCGYPPKDLVLKKQFIIDNFNYLNILKDKIPEKIYLVIGFTEENKEQGRDVFNSLALVKKGEIVATRQKVLLPTYDVFDEDRYFEPGKNIQPVTILNKKAGLSICEDIWHDFPDWKRPRYHLDPISKLVQEKIDFLINSSASPYFIGKPKIREEIIKNTAKKYKLPILFVNQVGGNDELIFDGHSCAVSSSGEVFKRLKGFEEDLQTVELENLAQSSELPPKASHREVKTDLPMAGKALSSNPEEELFQALTIGIRDYVRKCGFKKVIIGLSGGIDSALVAALATYAIGKDNVMCVFMPSRYSSKESKDDASAFAKNIGVKLEVLSIEEPFKAFLNLLLPNWKGQDTSLTEENIQSRIRGLILMAISNQTGALVLSTGNKSEIATGYCTLYGDMCGGLAVISDLPKTMVYKLAKFINKKASKELIPNNILTKAPTAELRLNQKDEDTLPPYDMLDQILNKYVEEHKPLKEIIKNGIPKDLAEKVCFMIDKSEYKREQAAPGLKVSSRSFGYGWRMPIAQQYKEQI